MALEAFMKRTQEAFVAPLAVLHGIAETYVLSLWKNEGGFMQQKPNFEIFSFSSGRRPQWDKEL